MIQIAKFLVIVCLFVAVNHSANGDELAKRVSSKYDFYVWTDDLPHAASKASQALGITQSDVDQWLTLNLDRLEFEEDQRTWLDEKIEVVRKELLERLFTGEAMVAFANVESERPRFVFIAACSDDAQRVFNLLETALEVVCFLQEPAAFDELKRKADEQETSNEHSDDDSIRKLPFGLGFASVEDAWLIWGNERDDVAKQLLRLRDQLDELPQDSLANEKTYLLFKRNLQSNDAPLVAGFANRQGLAYLMDNGLDQLTQSIFPSFASERWHAETLNGLNGIGFSICELKDEGKNAGATLLYLEGLLLTSLPRSGVLSAVQNQEGLRYDVPIIVQRLDEYVEIQLDGDELVDRLEEMRKFLEEVGAYDNLIYSSFYQDEDWVNGYGMEEERWRQVFSSLNGISSYRGLDERLVMAGGEESYELIEAPVFATPFALHFADEGEPEDSGGRHDRHRMCATILESQYAAGPLKLEVSSSSDEGIHVVRVSNAGISLITEQLSSYYDRMKTDSRRAIRDQYAKQDLEAPTDEQIDSQELKLALERWNSSLACSLAMLNNEVFVEANGWMMLNSIQTKRVERISQPRKSHVQLQQLSTRVDRMKEDFDVDSPVAVIAKWPGESRLIYRERVEQAEEAYAKRPATIQWERSQKPIERLLVSLKKTIRRNQSESPAWIGIAEKHPRGFRFVARTYSRSQNRQSESENAGEHDED